MQKNRFILQGFTRDTHLAAIKEMFEVPDIQRVILSVAFVSENGVALIEQHLKASNSNLTIFAGIRNEITSLQALSRMLAIEGCELVTVDTGTRHVLFHPKLYLVRGNAEARLIVGSANLTIGGLNNNVEASMILRFDLSNTADNAIVAGIEEQFARLVKEHPFNVVKIENIGEIDALLASGRLANEFEVPPPRANLASRQGAATDLVQRIKLQVSPLRRALGTARVTQQSKKAGIESLLQQPLPTSAPTMLGQRFELVWESKPLERRDLNIPDGPNTNKTGSISLDKGRLPSDVDHRLYFREVVFEQLAWDQTARKTTEEAYAKFHLVIKGVSFGEFDLRIGHTIGTTSRAYQQNNAMTRLSWGAVKAYVGNEKLKGGTLSLFRDMSAPDHFVLEID